MKMAQSWRWRLADVSATQMPCWFPFLEPEVQMAICMYKACALQQLGHYTRTMSLGQYAPSGAPGFDGHDCLPDNVLAAALADYIDKSLDGI